jgi:hypothetical protein
VVFGEVTRRHVEGGHALGVVLETEQAEDRVVLVSTFVFGILRAVHQITQGRS